MRRQCREGHPNKTRRRRGGEEEGTACMSQQPAMSSFSALEFHAGHLQRSRVSRLTIDDPAAILVNRFITPEESRVADTFSRRLSSAGRGPVIPFVSSTRLPNRNPDPCPKMMRRRFGWSLLVWFNCLYFLFFFFTYFYLADDSSRASGSEESTNLGDGPRIRHNYARIAGEESVQEGARGWGPFQIRIGRDQKSADGSDKLSNLWIGDGASVNSPCYRPNLSIASEKRRRRNEDQRNGWEWHVYNI